MANDRDNNSLQPGSENTENLDRERTEQFNELSETSLEERMAVADQLGIPTNNTEETLATGTMRSDESDVDRNNLMDEDNTEEEADR